MRHGMLDAIVKRFKPEMETPRCVHCGNPCCLVFTIAMANGRQRKDPARGTGADSWLPAFRLSPRSAPGLLVRSFFTTAP